MIVLYPRPYNLGHKTMFNRDALIKCLTAVGLKDISVFPEIDYIVSGSILRKMILHVKNMIKLSWPGMFASRYIGVGTK